MEASRASIFDFITDEAFRGSLAADYAELTRCREAGAWKAVHVLAGSIIEAVLIDYLVAQGLVDRDGALKLDLAGAIGLAKREKVISARASDLSSVIRDYRNLIHPGRAIRLGETMDRETARVAESVVSIIVSEVSKKRLENYGYTAEQIATKLEEDASACAIIRHLLKETSEREIERLMLVVLPERYLSAFEDEFAAPHILGALTTCFRSAVDNADPALAAKVAKWFVALLKEESGRAVFSYGTAFLRAVDLQYLPASEQELVREHLLSRLKDDPTLRLLDALDGIGLYLREVDVVPFIDSLMRLACTDNPLSSDSRRVLTEEAARVSPERSAECVTRFLAWQEMYQKRGDEQKAAIVAGIKSAYDEEVPF